MSSRLFTLLAGALCTAALTAWVRSYFCFDWIVFGSGPRRWLIVIVHGMAKVGQSKANSSQPSGFSWDVFSPDRYERSTPWSVSLGHNATGWSISAPFGSSSWHFLHACGFNSIDIDRLLKGNAKFVATTSAPLPTAAPSAARFQENQMSLISTSHSSSIPCSRIFCLSFASFSGSTGDVGFLLWNLR